MNGPGINVNWVPGITLDEMEKNCILAAFRFYRSNKTHTAQALGIAIRTLETKLEKYEADSKRETQRIVDERTRQREINERMRGPELTRRFQLGGGDQIRTSVDEDGDEADHEASAEFTENGNGAGSGERVEPTLEAGTESPMPVPKRKEVQGVLQRQAPSHSKHRNR